MINKIAKTFRPSITVLSLLLSVLLVGCKTPGQSDAEKLRKSIDEYNRAYRWKAYQTAAGYLPGDIRTAFVSTYESLKNDLDIRHYQIIALDRRSEKEALVQVRYRYVLLPSVTVEEKTVSQHWRLISGSWILEYEKNSVKKLDRTTVKKDPEESWFYQDEENPLDKVPDARRN